MKYAIPLLVLNGFYMLGMDWDCNSALVLGSFRTERIRALSSSGTPKAAGPMVCMLFHVAMSILTWLGVARMSLNDGSVVLDSQTWIGLSIHVPDVMMKGNDSSDFPRRNLYVGVARCSGGPCRFLKIWWAAIKKV